MFHFVFLCKTGAPFIDPRGKHCLRVAECSEKSTDSSFPRLFVRDHFRSSGHEQRFRCDSIPTAASLLQLLQAGSKWQQHIVCQTVCLFYAS